MSIPTAVAFTAGLSSVAGPLTNLAPPFSYYYVGPTLLPASYSHLVAQPAYSMAQPNLAAPIVHLTGTPQPEHMGPTPLSGQPTTLPCAFNIVSLQDLTSGAWNMDTGASSYLNNSVTNLHDVFNTCVYSSISDFLTRWVLLRCDITGDLYPVTAPSPNPHVFLVSQHTWNQRLGHPWAWKSHELPFVRSGTVISSCFDIIHSDVWTSPIPSLSGSDKKMIRFGINLDVYNEEAKKNNYLDRTKNMLMGKCTPMNQDDQKFISLVLETSVMSEEKDEDWMTRVEILYKTYMGSDFKHKSAWRFLEDKHK
nr:hypothetical protein [Tanacetum cinerariifolium]